jgi:hypothetical protein
LAKAGLIFLTLLSLSVGVWSATSVRQIEGLLIQKDLQIASLKREIETLRSQRAKSAEVESLRPPQTGTVKIPPVRNPTQSDGAKSQTPDKSTWRARYLLGQVERHISLSAEERVRLTEEFKQGESLAVLEPILGPERAKEFESRREIASSEDEEEELQNELFRLSRKLKLSAEQERRLDNSLRAVRVSLKPSFDLIKTQGEQAMSLHSSSAPEDGAQLRGLYDEMQKQITKTKAQERKLLLEELSGVLSDEQLNLFLEDRE